MKLEETDEYFWTRERMPLIYKMAEKLELTKQKIALDLPLTWETLCFIDAVRKKIPNLMVVPQTSAENSSLQPGVFRYLTEWHVYHAKKASGKNRLALLYQRPDIIIDCNFILGEMAIKNNLLKENTVIIEDTKTGENRMNNYNLQNPFIILDNSYLKKEYENKEGIGYSVITALSSIGFYLPKYKIGIIGYGYVGRGIAKYAKAMGAKAVIICEIDPQRRRQAGKLYSISNKRRLLYDADIVITATGRENIISRTDVCYLNKELILVNAGGGEEWNRRELFGRLKLKRIHPYIIQVKIGKCTLQEICGGNSINLVIGVSMSEFLDITFAQLIIILTQIRNLNLHGGKNEISLFDLTVLKREMRVLTWL